MNQLEPDRNQIEIFAEALFRYAPDNSFVSLRAFYHDNKIFRITPVRLNGNGFRYLCEAAEDDARRAAQAPKPVVFCPPIATFSNSKRAREEDLAAGLALSVELDQHPHEALTRLEEIIGPATIIVRSGGNLDRSRRRAAGQIARPLAPCRARPRRKPRQAENSESACDTHSRSRRVEYSVRSPAALARFVAPQGQAALVRDRPPRT